MLNLLRATCLTLAAATPALAEATIALTDGYVRLLPGARSGAAFFTVENHGAADDRLLSVTTGIAGRAELHSHQMTDDGMMHMGPIEGGLVIPAGEVRRLESGGDHVMLMALTAIPAEGEAVDLTVTFERAGPVILHLTIDNHR